MTYRPQNPGGISFGMGGPPPRDVLVLLAVVFLTYSAQFFTDVLVWLRLTPLALRSLLVWQVATYPWIGMGGASIWILLELLILFWFASDVYRSLGRRRFWTLMLYSTVGAGVAAALVDLLAGLLGYASPVPFQLMQGQRMLTVVMVAAFATLHRHATILLFFVLPIQARWFVWLEILIAFIGFLGTKDIAGFVGICCGVALTVALLGPGRLSGGLRRWRLLWERWWVQMRLGRLRRRRGLHLVRPPPGRGGDGGWIH